MSESALGSSWKTPVIDDSNATVPADGGEGTATVDNEWALGGLEISKSLSGGPAGYDGPFSIAYLCVFEGSADISDEISLAAGAKWSRDDIPVGYVCTVTEKLPGAPSGYTWSTPVISGSPTAAIAADTTRAVTVGNQLNLIPPPPPPPPPGSGILEINKVVTGGPDTYVGPFDIDYTCTNGGPSGTASVTAGVPFAIGNIPNGSVCTVSEKTLPTAPAGFFWSSQSDSGGTVTISEGKTSSVTVTNGLTPIPVAPAVIPPAPAVVPVPTKPVLPASVPAGDGSEFGKRAGSVWMLLMLVLGTAGALSAAAHRRRLREE